MLDAHLLACLEHQLGEVLNPLLEQEQLIAVAMESGLGNTERTLREPRHAFQHRVQSRRHQIDHRGKDQDVDRGGDPALPALEDADMPRHLLHRCMRNEGRKQHAGIGASYSAMDWEVTR